MIVVHPDVDFLDDIAGKLKEVFALFLNYPYHCVIIWFSQSNKYFSLSSYSTKIPNFFLLMFILLVIWCLLLFVSQMFYESCILFAW